MLLGTTLNIILNEYTRTSTYTVQIHETNYPLYITRLFVFL